MSPSNKNCYVNNVGENHKTSQVIYSKIGHQLLQYAEYILGMAMWDGMLTLTIIIIVGLSVC